MSKTFWGLCHKNIRDLLKQKKRNSLMFILPLTIIIVILMFFAGSDVEKSFLQPIKIGVVDQDKSFYSNALVENYKNNESFTDFIEITVGKDEIIHDFNAGQYDALIEIPQNFAEHLMHFEKVPVQVKVAYSDPLKAVLFKHVMESYEKFITSVQVGVELLYNEMEALNMSDREISIYNIEISYDLIMTALGRNRFFQYHEWVNIPSTTSVNYFFIAIMMMFLLYISVFIAIDLIRERENMCFRRLKIARVSIYEYLMSKLFMSTIFIGLFVLSWFVLLSFLTPLNLSGNTLYIVLYLLSCIMLAVSLAICISGLFKRDEGVVLVSHVFIFVNAIIGGSIIPLHYMPNILQRLAVFTPNYWMIKGMLYIESGYNIAYGMQIAGSFFIMSMVFIFIAYRSYQHESAI
ncbi:ABC transporter permease [Vallitalea pronyensis]|uniref:ABC transporter permease n=1 Tax=Vallitalea pronyensis TaxID=1348613 RepID=A0A8J8SHA1_9FIRM|nr:ABC transporter permease [Vallitalea pronyensis]QUI23158.1 ABC transporter permease [Vallitalea pronyensis]